jgi:hypothetical protein
MLHHCEQNEAAAAYSRKHSLASHQAQVVGLYPLNVKGASALNISQDALHAVAGLMVSQYCISYAVHVQAQRSLRMHHTVHCSYIGADSCST